MRIFLKIMYDGSGFCGWQIQPNQSSIQGEITEAIHKLTGLTVTLTGSGRTDASVHALGQTAHFDLTSDFDTSKLVGGLNFYLPPSIRIIEAKEINDSFNARFSAISKTYEYLFYSAPIPNPLLQNRALQVGNINITRMQRAAKLFIGTHDFAPFMSSGSDVKTTIRTILGSRIYKKGDLFVYEVSANGFLYNMVRKMIAVLLSVGTNKRSPLDIKHILSKGRQVKDLAPPHALYLKSVYY